MSELSENLTYEEAYAQLEEVLGSLETGDLPLDKSLQQFEKGVKLSRECQTALEKAEQKVEILLKSAGGEELEEFDIDDQ